MNESDGESDPDEQLAAMEGVMDFFDTTLPIIESMHHAAREVMSQLTQSHQPRLEILWADTKYHNHALYEWIDGHEEINWKLEVVRRPQGVNGFVLLPKRWVVERTFSWLGRWRRLSRDYEHRPDSSEAMVKVASIGRMLRYFAPSGRQAPFKYRVTA